MRELWWKIRFVLRLYYRVQKEGLSLFTFGHENGNSILCCWELYGSMFEKGKPALTEEEKTVVAPAYFADLVLKAAYED